MIMKFNYSSACVFGDGLSSFRDGVSGQFSGEEELDRCLHLAGAEGTTFAESDELRGFEGDSVEGVIDE